MLFWQLFKHLNKWLQTKQWKRLIWKVSKLFLEAHMNIYTYLVANILIKDMSVISTKLIQIEWFY